MFDQAVRQPMLMDDSARENTLALQRDNGEASVSLSPHLSPNSMGREKKEEWVICELDELGNLVEECQWLSRAEAAA